jgi:hypothetical protein
LSIRQDQPEARIDVRSDAGWQTILLKNLTDRLVLDRFGLTCTLGDLYRGTSLQSPPA